MNRRNLLIGAVAASACGAGLVPAAVAAQPQPGPHPRSHLRPFWDAARAHYKDHRYGIETNEVVSGQVRAFMAEHGMTFPMVFPGSQPGSSFTMLGMRERRRDDGVLELGISIHSDDIVFHPENSGTHFEIINTEYPRA